LNVLNITEYLSLANETQLDLHSLAINAQEAAAAFIASGTAANTLRSYRSALVGVAATALRPGAGRCGIALLGSRTVCG